MKTEISLRLSEFLQKQKEKVAEAVRLVSTDEKMLSELDTVLIGSDYVADQLRRDPALLTDLSSDLYRSYQPGELAKRIFDCIEGIEAEEELTRKLRQIRRREMVRVIWRDLNRLADLKETTGTLSDLADAITDRALKWLHALLVKDFGEPTSKTGALQRLSILGMGKLGAHELNLSSDIDLIFAFAENGDTQGGRRTLSNQEFFSRLGKRLIKALDMQTADGFVFRVDMRLRPFGGSGPLVASFEAMENYYQDQGRDWERYALIKARVIAGDLNAGAQLLDTLRPFIYRRYIDYSAFDSLREMKAMITRENRIKGREQNIKLGAGGIREIEFIAQAFQLIRGGRDTRLQQRELLNILALLPECAGLPEQVAVELATAYIRLRNVEHAIQALADRQTQELPSDDLERARVAWITNKTDWDTFIAELNEHRALVSRHFSDVITPSEKTKHASPKLTENELRSIWEIGFEDNELLHTYLEQLGFSNVDQIANLLKEFRALKTVKFLQTIGQDRLLQLLPLLLEALVSEELPEQTLERALRLIQSVVRRSAYLVLLAENPGALRHLIRLCSASGWFADQLARQPVLLDELIDAGTLFNPPKAEELRTELRQHLLRIPEDDIEQLMETLRYFKNAHILRVAAADITGTLPLMKVSDYLSWLAEAILQAVLEIAWRDLTIRYGTPSDASGEPCNQRFIIVGYGKLGGIELSYGSDLDLVFIHDVPADRTTIGGPREIANAVFFARFGQRIIHLLNTFTPSGQLYDVDIRLRPSGNSGLLVSSLEAFRQYQLKEAWTWEHQALLRSRVIAGSKELEEAFNKVRGEILSTPREANQLREEVISMRDKMRQHLGSSQKSEGFDLKQDVGGMVDIEFCVQYLVLKYACKSQKLYEFTDNIRIIEVLKAEHYLSQAQAAALTQAYIVYRSYGHRQTLQNQKGLVSDSSLETHRKAVEKVWNEILSV